MKRLKLGILCMLMVSSVYAQIPTDSLYFYAPLDGDYDDIIGKVKGKATGTTNGQNRNSKDSTAFYLNGSNDFIDYGHPDDYDIDYFSASIWIQTIYVDYPSTVRNTIFGDAGNGGGFRFFQEDNDLQFVVSPPATIGLTHTLNKEDKAGWMHLVGTNNHDTVKLYVDGRLVKTVINTNTPDQPNLNLEIGRGTEKNSVYWEGKVDDAMIYKKPLSAKEVKQLYNFQNSAFAVYDTIRTKVTDTVKVQDTIRIMDTIRVMDTISIVKTIYDTITVEDTLNFELVTGISTHPKHHLALYPNPAGSNLNVRIGDYDKLKGFSFTITNSLGKVVWSEASTQSNFTVDVVKLGGTGTYIFKVFDSGFNEIERKILIVI